MARLNALTGTAMRVSCFILQADGITPATGYAGAQPQRSTSGGAWTNTTNSLMEVGNGYYWLILTIAEIGTAAGALLTFRYKDGANTVEAIFDTVQVGMLIAGVSCFILQTDGVTPATGEGGSRPKISRAAGTWVDATNTLVALGNGYYWLPLTTAELGNPSDILIFRHKGGSTLEAIFDTVQVGPVIPNETKTKRQQIVTQLDARLKTILVVNGYKSDIGAHVFPWQATPLEIADLPAILYRDSQNDPQDGGPIGQFRWGLIIEIDIVISGSTSLSDIRNMLQDLHRCISIDRRWSGLAESTEQPSDSIQIEQKDNIVCGASLKLSIIYDSPLWEQ